MKSSRATGTNHPSYGLLTGTTCAAIATLIPVAAHQIGVIDHLPDPPGHVFASDRITDSKAAHPLGIPDGILGLCSYGATLALIAVAKRHSAARRLLAFKLLGDGALAGFNVGRQIVSFGRLCSWCTATALSTAVMLFAGYRIIAQEAGVARSWR